MIKKIIISMFLSMILFTDVNAKTDDDYEYIGYKEVIESEEGEYIYEGAILNRFYKNVETNLVYDEESANIESSPFIDKSDVKENTSIIYDRIKGSSDEYFVLIPDIDNFKTNWLTIERFITYYAENEALELEIYAKDRKVNYEIDDNRYSFLNDGDKTQGNSMQFANFEIDLDDYYDIEDLRIVVYLKQMKSYPDRLTITYHGDEDDFESTVYLNLNLTSDSITNISVSSQEEIDELMAENNFEPYNDGVTNKYHYYIHRDILVKHYNIEREYYENSFEDSIDGYIYDRDESIPVVKIYRKISIGESDTNEIDEIKTVEPKVIEPIVTITTSSEMEESPIECEPKKDETVEFNPIIPKRKSTTSRVEEKEEEVKPELAVLDNNTKDSEIKIEEQETSDTKKESNQRDYIRYYVILVLVLVFTYVIYRIVHLLYKQI